jgi:hypothetical protein
MLSTPIHQSHRTLSNTFGLKTADDPNIKEYYRAEELQTSSSAVTALASLPPRFVADFLVQAFFKHGETNYFYVERGWLMSKLDTAYENPSSLSRRDVGTVCMLFIVLAIGTQYAYLDSPGERRSDGHSHSPTGNGPFSEDAIGVMFYQQATKLIPDVITIASLESVQACLLIGLYTLPLDASGLSYIYLNLAVKLGIQNGMHRKYTGEGLDPVIRETRNRVWWTAYITEKYDVTSLTGITQCADRISGALVFFMADHYQLHAQMLMLSCLPIVLTCGH